MAGSHRDTEAKVRTPGPAAVTGLLLAVVATIGLGLWALSGIFGGDDAATDSSAPPTARSPMTSAPPASPSTASTPSASPSRTSATPASDGDLPRIPEASPRRLRSGDLIDAGFDTALTPEAGEFNAASSAELSRVATRGRPGSPGADTVVVIGEDRFDRPAALNRIGDLQTGDTIELETYNADLTYTIERSFEVDSSAVPGNAAVTAKVRGRLVLIATTYDSNGNRADRDTIVVAGLTSARTR